MAEKAPVVLKEKVPKAEAELLMAKLVEAGCKITLK
jgi:ribosomal protein L7/L12